MTSAAPVSVQAGRVALAAAVTWAVALVVGGLVLQGSASRPGNPVSPSRGVFLAANVATLTGFETTWLDVEAVRWPAIFVTLAAAACRWVFVVAAMHRLARVPIRWLSIALAFTIPLLLSLAASLATRDPMLAASATGGSALVGRAVATSSADLWTVLLPVAALSIVGPFLLAWACVGRTVAAQSRFVVMGLAVGVLVTLPIALMIGEPALAFDARWAGVAHAAQDLPAIDRWLLVPIVLLGDAGGLKTTTLVLLALGTVAAIRGGATPAFGVAVAWLFALVAVFALTFVTLLATYPQGTADGAALMAASAVATAGQSARPLDVAGGECFVLAAAMVLGHVLPMAVLWWGVTRPGTTVSPG